MDGSLIPGRDGVSTYPGVRTGQVYRQPGRRDDALAPVVGAPADVAVHQGGADRGGTGALRTVGVRGLPHRPAVGALLREVLPVVGVREPRGGAPSARARRHVGGAGLRGGGGVGGGVLGVGDGARGAAALRLRVAHCGEDVVVVHLRLEPV